MPITIEINNDTKLNYLALDHVNAYLSNMWDGDPCPLNWDVHINIAPYGDDLSTYDTHPYLLWELQIIGPWGRSWEQAWYDREQGTILWMNGPRRHARPIDIYDITKMPRIWKSANEAPDRS